MLIVGKCSGDCAETVTYRLYSRSIREIYPSPLGGTSLRTVLAELMIRRTLLSPIPFDSMVIIGTVSPP